MFTKPAGGGGERKREKEREIDWWIISRESGESGQAVRLQPVTEEIIDLLFA